MNTPIRNALLLATALPCSAGAASAMTLEQYTAALSGTWNGQYESYATPFSGPGKGTYTELRECRPSGTGFSCVTAVNGRLIRELTYAPAAAGGYVMKGLSVNPQQPVAAGNLDLGAGGFVEKAETKDARGNTLYLRSTGTFDSKGALATKSEIKAEGGQWATIVTKTETRTAPYALAPAAPSPALDAVADAYGGEWKAETENYSSEISQAGSHSSMTNRSCWRDGDSLKCLLSDTDKLLAELVFRQDKNGGGYEEQATSPGGQINMTVTVKGNTWVYLYDDKNQQGATTHYRQTRVFKSPDSYENRAEFSHDGVDWVTYSIETDTRTKPSE